MKDEYKYIIQGTDYCKLLEGRCPSSQLEYELCNWILDLQSQLQKEMDRVIELESIIQYSGMLMNKVIKEDKNNES